MRRSEEGTDGRPSRATSEVDRPGATARVLMVLVGATLFAFYAAAAAVSYVVVASFVRDLSRGDLLTTVVAVVGLTLLFGYLSHQYGTAQILYGLDAREIPPGHAPALYDRLGVLAGRMGVDPPVLAVARMEMPNALALGGGRRGIVVLDGRLFRLLDGPELETILAHELAHLESRDSLVQTLAYSLARTFVGVVSVALFPLVVLLRGLSRAVAWGRGRPTCGTPSVDRVHATVARAVLLVLAVLTLLVRAHSRRREFAADERAAEVTGRPLALARALRTIEHASLPASGLLSTLYVYADEEDPLTRMLSTHPPTDERVERLVEMADRSSGSGGVRVPVR